MQTSCPARLLLAASLSAVLWLSPELSGAQPGTLAPDLTAAPAARDWQLINRSAHLIEKDGAPALHLEGKDGYGYARLTGLEFVDGTIEFDARGRDVLQGSFLGLAFHGADDRTYDAIYFRPFNFRAADPVRRAHAVQYISHPTYTWKKLRTDSPDRYEQPIVPPPAPDAWFHVSIVIAWPRVSVFVDHAPEPCLVVDQLSQRKRGWIALWTDVAGGDFANLRITPTPAR